MQPHKHAELIKAWADGHPIQYRNADDPNDAWDDVARPTWSDDWEYRIAPPEDVIEVGDWQAVIQQGNLLRYRRKDSDLWTHTGRISPFLVALVEGYSKLQSDVLMLELTREQDQEKITELLDAAHDRLAENVRLLDDHRKIADKLRQAEDDCRDLARESNQLKRDNKALRNLLQEARREIAILKALQKV